MSEVTVSRVDTKSAGEPTGPATQSGQAPTAPALRLDADQFPALSHWLGLSPDEFRGAVEPLVSMARDVDRSPELRRSIGAAVHYLVHLRKLQGS